MQIESYNKVPECQNPDCRDTTRMTGFGISNDTSYQVWTCNRCGEGMTIYDTAQSVPPLKPFDHDVVAHDNIRTTDITQENWALLVEALGMAIACTEVEVDVAQAEADAKADRLRDLEVLKRKMEEA
jgi:hypothetical protein